MATQVSNSDYTKLIDNTYTRPSACADDDLLSCITYGGKSYRVSWSTTLGTDANNILVDAPSTIKVSAQLTTYNGKNIEGSATARAPIGNWSASDYSALRISISNPANYSGPLYLYSAKSGVNRVIAASNPIGSGNKVVIRYLTANCGPCRLSITSTGDNILQNYMLDQAASSNYGYIINSLSGLNDINAVIRTSSKITLNLWAHNSDGNYLPPPQSTAGSLCLYIKYSEGDKTYKVPGCTTSSNPTQIIYNTFTVKTGITNGDYTTGIPSGVPLTFSTDGVSNGESCLNPNDVAGLTFSTTKFSGSTFISGYECTSWTWGYPKYLNTNNQLYSSSGKLFEGGKFTPTSGSKDVEIGVTWDTNLSAPAAGFQSGDALWGKPRTYRSTSTSLTSSQLLSSDTSCGYHCNSALDFNPYPSTGRFATPMGPQWAVVYNSSSGLFSISFTDNDFSASKPITISLASQTGSGKIYYNTTDTNYIPVGTTLVSNCTSLPCSFSAYYRSPGALDSLQLTATQNGSSKTYTIGLAPTSTSIWGVVPSTVYQSINQGESKFYILNSYNFQGVLQGGASYTLSKSSTSLSLSTYPDNGGTYQTSLTNVTSNGTCPDVLIGQSCIIVTPSSTLTPGSYSITNSTTNGIYSYIISEIVIQKPSTLTIISSTNANQGEDVSIVGEVKDAANQPVSNAPIFINSVYNNSGLWTPGVKPSSISCLTDSNGRCTLTLTLQKGAPSGTYNYSLTSNSLSASGTFTVSKVVNLIELQNKEIAQGGSITIPIRVLDGAGTAVSGITPTISSKSNFTSSFSGPTDSTGLTTLNLAATAQAKIGRNDFTVTSGSVSKKLTINVTCLVKSLSSSILELPQGGNNYYTFLLLDINGDACNNGQITLTPSTALQVGSKATSNSQGYVSINISTPISTPLGSYYIDIKNTQGSLIGSIAVSVKIGLNSITAKSILSKGTTSDILFDFKDSSATLIANLPYIVKSLSPELVINGSVNGIYSSSSLSSGFAKLNFTTSPNIKPGFYEIIFTVNKKDYQISVAVI